MQHLLNVYLLRLYQTQDEEIKAKGGRGGHTNAKVFSRKEGILPFELGTE
tara:strand:- start:67 stop:216 length:150 start_codon:yes stop_codon:yes gene_type:complete